MLIHWIWLAHRPGLTDRMKVALLQHFRDPEDVFFADKEAFRHIDGLTVKAVGALQNKDLAPAEKILAVCARKRIHIMTYRDVSYPGRLRHIPDPPLVLYYKGTLPDFDGLPLIGVVGTRKATPYGLKIAGQMGSELARCGGVVVSGVADGIDANAMQGALSAGSTTVGVLGCGADVIYPYSNRYLYADTERYGCLLSEFPPGTPAYRWNFPKRNRIISGLSCGVLVVEAPEISGALITARQALEQGRDVFVVPGNVDQPTFVGSNRLLREGAIPACSGWDVMCEYEALYPDKIRRDQTKSRLGSRSGGLRRAAEAAEPPAKVAQQQYLPAEKPAKKEKSNKKVVDNGAAAPYSDVNKDLSALSPDEQAIVQALRGGERLIDDVIAEAGLPARQVSSALTMLAIKGVIQKLPGNRICLK